MSIKSIEKKIIKLKMWLLILDIVITSMVNTELEMKVKITFLNQKSNMKNSGWLIFGETPKSLQKKQNLFNLDNR